MDGGGGYPAAVAVVLAAVALLVPLRGVLQPPTVMLLFVPVIMGLTRLFGMGPSAAASVAAFLAVDYVFLAPYYRLSVRSPSEWIGLAVFLAVALGAGRQTDRLARRGSAAERRRNDLELLNALSFRMASASSPEQVAGLAVESLAAALRAERIALYAAPSSSGAARSLATAGRQAPSSGEEAFVKWVLQHGSAVGLPLSTGESGAGPRSVAAGDAVPGVAAEGVYVPLRTADSREGVLHAVLPAASSRDDAGASLLLAVSNLVAASFERRRLEEQAAHAAALREADKLKTTLVSSVSHELKTPLAAATARVTGLVEEAAVAPERMREELVAVAEDLGRLNASIGDLLDLSRLESDAWRPQRESYDVGEILGTVLSRLPASQRQRVRFSLSPTPAVSADFAQLARALVNLVENALAYSPPSEMVVVSTALAGAEVLVTVEDRGPGVGDAEKSRVFDKFYRGGASGSAPGGTGLGLTIAREIVRSHGGRLYVEDAEPRGARFVVALPAYAGRAWDGE
jgi:two-component system, OmpR family, sensor histidine kinase KdpD